MYFKMKGLWNIRIMDAIIKISDKIVLYLFKYTLGYSMNSFSRHKINLIIHVIMKMNKIGHYAFKLYIVLLSLFKSL